MNEFYIDLNSERFDFSRDSRIRETLLQSLLSRQAERRPVSLSELLAGERGGKPSQTSQQRLPGRERDIPPPDKGRKGL